MDCKYTGIVVVRQVRKSERSRYVVSDKALMSKMYKQFPEEYEEKSTNLKPTGRPAGWHFMNEFVDKDGNVFHKGKEQPKLKGTLPPTKVKPKKESKRRTKDEILSLLVIKKSWQLKDN